MTQPVNTDALTAAVAEKLNTANAPATCTSMAGPALVFGNLRDVVAATIEVLVTHESRMKPMDATDRVATELRRVAAGDDSYGGFLYVEASAMDKVCSAAPPQGDSDADRLAEVRAIVAALRQVRDERRSRLGRR